MANLTQVCPIIVTPNMEIIDSQNRFEVCKSKDMPIYYVVYDGDAETAMKALNTCAQPWRQGNGCKSYIFWHKIQAIVREQGIQERHAW